MASKIPQYLLSYYNEFNTLKQGAVPGHSSFTTILFNYALIVKKTNIDLKHYVSYLFKIINEGTVWICVELDLRFEYYRVTSSLICVKNNTCSFVLII